jgi:hypothetical protein
MNRGSFYFSGTFFISLNNYFLVLGAVLDLKKYLLNNQKFSLSRQAKDSPPSVLFVGVFMSNTMENIETFFLLLFLFFHFSVFPPLVMYARVTLLVFVPRCPLLDQWTKIKIHSPFVSHIHNFTIL